MKFEINHSAEGWELTIRHENWTDHYVYTNLGTLLKRVKALVLQQPVATP
jgi:hypothetical protein